MKMVARVLLALTASLAQAQGKTAVLNIQQAIVITDEAQKRFSELRAQSSYKDNKGQIDRLRKEHDDIIKKLQKDMAVMSDEQKRQQQGIIEEKDRKSVV